MRVAWTDIETIKKIVEESKSIQSVISKMGYRAGGTTREKLHDLIHKHSISTIHFTPRDRSNIISEMDNEQMLRDVVAQSRSFAETLRRLGMVASGGSYAVLHKRLRKFDINTNHFDHKNTNIRERLPDEVVYCENSQMERSGIKARLMRDCLIDYKCSSCGNGGVWNNQLLSLQLEHRNGVCTDNRLENLTFLCPNCHSQTDTFSGKNKQQAVNNRLCS